MRVVPLVVEGVQLDTVMFGQDRLASLRGEVVDNKRYPLSSDKELPLSFWIVRNG